MLDLSQCSWMQTNSMKSHYRYQFMEPYFNFSLIFNVINFALTPLVQKVDTFKTFWWVSGSLGHCGPSHSQHPCFRAWTSHWANKRRTLFKMKETAFALLVLIFIGYSVAEISEGEYKSFMLDVSITVKLQTRREALRRRKTSWNTWMTGTWSLRRTWTWTGTWRWRWRTGLAGLRRRARTRGSMWPARSGPRGWWRWRPGRWATLTPRGTWSGARCSTRWGGVSLAAWCRPAQLAGGCTEIMFACDDFYVPNDDAWKCTKGSAFHTKADSTPVREWVEGSMHL